MSTSTDTDSPVYLDCNATTPLDSRVSAAIVDALELWANSSSNNPMGICARDAISVARQRIAALLGIADSGVVFTSGGTESNNQVLHCALRYYREVMQKGNPNLSHKLPHIITTNIEHPAIAKPLQQMVEDGLCSVTVVDVCRTTGMVSEEMVAAAVREETCLITVMMANNETGVVQPLAKISRVCKAKSKTLTGGSSVLFHSDCAQTVGKLPVNLADLGLDYATVVGHKFYGPRIGALCTTNNVSRPIYPLLYGGGQESGIRPGTENTPMIVGLGEACRIAKENCNLYQTSMCALRDYFEMKLQASIGGVIIHFQASPRLPNTSSVAFPNLNCTAVELLAQCRTFHASTGAACHANEIHGSMCLRACGIPERLALRTIRFSLGRDTSIVQLDRVVAELTEIHFRLCRHE